jgi:membrane-bound lytic murein transglycosylase MltF
VAAERFTKSAANNDNNDRLREFSLSSVFFSALALADQGVPLTRTTDILEGYQSREQLIGTIPPDVDSAELQPFFGDLTDIRKRRLLRVLVTNSQTDFFVDGGKIRGIQAELAGQFVQQLNRGFKRESNRIFVQFIPVEFHQLIPALLAGKGDVVAAFLTINDERSRQVQFSSGKMLDHDEVVVAHKDAPALESIEDLSGKSIYVLKSSSYLAHLQGLNQSFVKLGLAPIDIVSADKRLLTEDILELVNAGIVQYTICDDFKVNLWQRVLANIKVYDDITIAKDQHVGWATRKKSPELEQALNKFVKRAEKGSLIGNVLFERYLNNTVWIDNPTHQTERAKLSELMVLFEKYGSQYGFDPLALAAQGYQESKLDQSRVSHRGAIGIMQVLPTTAKDPKVNIDNIEELENNIHAAAKYLHFIQQRYYSSPDISPWNQRLFTWAAYNAGPANVTRLRNAAARKGYDENVWFGNVEVMAAYMISREPIRYVANIHKYYTAYRLLEQREMQRVQALEAQVESQ